MVLGRKYWIKRGRRGLKVVEFTVIVLGIGDEYGLFRFEAFSDGIGITKKKILSKMTSLLTITKNDVSHLRNKVSRTEKMNW